MLQQDDDVPLQAHTARVQKRHEFSFVVVLCLIGKKYFFTRATGLYYTSSSPTKKKNNDSVHVVEVGDGGDEGDARPRSLQQTGDAAAVCWMCPPCTLDRRVSLPEP